MESPAGNSPLTIESSECAEAVSQDPKQCACNGRCTGALGKTLLIANPAAQNGKGITAALYVEDWMSKVLPSHDFDLVITEGASHGEILAREAAVYDTVIALGGDGLAHEVANGLMRIQQAYRPVLGLLPAGTGNDFARTLGMSFDIETSTSQIMEATPRPMDLGCCNGRYYVETLSFGLDAAIALDTVETRKNTDKSGTQLFLKSGIDLLLHGIKHYPFTAIIDGGEPLSGEMLIFAVQNGPTYGGGFRICPEAETDDGVLDICLAKPPMGTVRALVTFLRAKNAGHVNAKGIEFHRGSTMRLVFEGDPPAQIDGEEIKADAYDVSVEKGALCVLVP